MREGRSLFGRVCVGALAFPMSSICLTEACYFYDDWMQPQHAWGMAHDRRGGGTHTHTVRLLFAERWFSMALSFAVNFDGKFVAAAPIGDTDSKGKRLR